LKNIIDKNHVDFERLMKVKIGNIEDYKRTIQVIEGQWRSKRIIGVIEKREFDVFMTYGGQNRNIEVIKYQFVKEDLQVI
jgi:hypothetical protein